MRGNKLYNKYVATTVLVWLGCAVLFVFAYVIILRPQGQLKVKLQKELAECKQVYEATLAASSEEARERLKKELEQRESKLRYFVAGKDDFSDLTFDISRIANDIEVSSFSIRARDGRRASDIPDCEHIEESQLDVSFNGSFTQFARFLNALERHQPVVFVDWFSVKKSAGDDVEGNDISMGLSVFVEKREKG